MKPGSALNTEAHIVSWEKNRSLLHVYGTIMKIGKLSKIVFHLSIVPIMSLKKNQFKNKTKQYIM